MCSCVLSLVVSIMLLLSSVMANAPASAALQQHPLAALAATDQAAGELPVGESAGHDHFESLFDIPDQLEGPPAPHGASLQARRMEPHLAASPTHPHLEGLQRPPRPSGRCA